VWDRRRGVAAGRSCNELRRPTRAGHAELRRHREEYKAVMTYEELKVRAAPRSFGPISALGERVEDGETFPGRRAEEGPVGAGEGDLEPLLTQ